VDSPPPIPERCPFCGHQSTDLDEYCPACNRRKTALNIEVIDHDLPCLQCDYILRGLRTNSQCPECGLVIARTLRGDYLIHSSPEYVRSVHIGARLVAAALLLSAAIALVALVLGFGEVTSSALAAILMSLIVVVSAINFGGWWLLTSPDPDQLKKNRVRLPTRCIVVISCVSQLIVWSLTLLAILRVFVDVNDDLSLFGIVASILSFVMFLSWPVRIIVGLYLLRALCRRLPDTSLAKMSRLLALQALGGIVFAFVIGIIVAAIGGGDDLATCTSLLLGVLLLVWNGIYLSLLGGISSQARLILNSQALGLLRPRPPTPPPA